MSKLSLLFDVAEKSLRGTGFFFGRIRQGSCLVPGPLHFERYSTCCPEGPFRSLHFFEVYFNLCSGEFHCFVSQLIDTFLYLPVCRPPSSGFQAHGPGVLSVPSQSVCLSSHWWRLFPPTKSPQRELSHDPWRR